MIKSTNKQGTLNKMTTKSMDLLEVPFKTNSTAKKIKDNLDSSVLYRISTSQIIWHLVKRHKFGLVSTWAVVVTIQWMFPPAFDMLTSLI